MVKEDRLTNEKINQDFTNPFTLVNHAIDLAKRLIVRDEDIEYNPVNRVLEMIEEKEEFDEAFPEKEQEQESE